MKVALLGDIALFGFFSKSNKNIYAYFKPIKTVLAGCDFVVANLETPLTTNTKPYGVKSANISSLPENVEILKYLGINNVNLANNHLFDFGKQAFEETKEILTNYSIEYFGVEGKHSFIEKKGNRIALAGFCCYSTNPLGLGKSGINALNYKVVEGVLNKNRVMGYNTILSIHAGQEHINYPNYDHIKFARKLSEISSYIYYGHHPHVLQGIEHYNNSLIAYSLGNFCFDDVYTKQSDKPLVRQSENNKSSIILELEYQNNRLVNYKTISIYAGENKMEIGNNRILNNLKKYSLKLAMDESDYKNMRNKILAEIKNKRTSQHDLNWYIKRMNIRTLFIIKDLLVNKIKYKINFKNYL